MALRRSAWTAGLVLGCLLCAMTAGCGTVGNIVLGVVGGTLVGAQAPGNEIEQVYYVGVFDPQDQLPPQIYRLTVRGQASMYSGVKFGSGWVHSSLIDSLQTRASFNSETGVPQIETGDKGDEDGGGETLPGLKAGRRLMMFGPEGFREAPRDHRLVIVMGASPEKFFQAIDQSLNLISRVQRDQIPPEVSRDLFTERERLRSERKALDALSKTIATDLAHPKPAETKPENAKGSESENKS